MARRLGWTAAQALLVLVFAASAVGVSIATPAFEAPDEVAHFGYVKHLVTTHRLPRLDQPTAATNEAGQAPLYYLAGALATFWIDAWADGPWLLPTWDDHNPHASFTLRHREPPDLENRNLYAHGPSERFPYRGDVLLLHLLRLVGVAFGVVAVVAALLTARELFPSRPEVALTAGAMLALSPQLIFMSAVVGNDVAAAATASLALLGLARVLRRGLNLRRSLFLGGALGLSLLAKLNLLGLVGVVGLGLLVVAVGQRRHGWPSVRLTAIHMGVVAATAFAVAGWWYLLNLRRYGDPLAWRPMLAAQEAMTRREPLPFVEAATALFDARDTYWAAFGWTNVLVDPIFYAGMDVLVALAMVGLLVGVARHFRSALRPRGFANGRAKADAAAKTMLPLLALWTLIALVGLVTWVQTNTAGGQGRLLFPAATAIALLLAVGLLSLAPRRTGPYLAVAVSAGMAIFSGVAFLSTLPAAYQAPPDVVAASDAPLERLDAVCACGIEVLGYRYAQIPRAPGDDVVVDVHWRVAPRKEGERARNWSMHFGLVDPADAERARTVSWPAGGRLPTSAAQPGVTYRERVRLRSSDAAAAPGNGRITLVFFYPHDGANGQAELTTRDGQPLPLRRAVNLGTFPWPARPAGG